MEERFVSKPVAIWACTSMALFYVGILHFPSLILSPPSNLKHFLIRRFICASISSLLSFLFSHYILSIKWDAKYLYRAYGMRIDHFWQALMFPLSLTSLIYAGSFVRKAMLLIDSWEEFKGRGGSISISHIKFFLKQLLSHFCSVSSNIQAWRNYIVAPITEEVVFRACMIPLLIGGGFDLHNIIFLNPAFFSLSHLNHLCEIYGQQNRSWLRTFMVLGLQLGYTVVFGSYATFLFIRTGHLLAPVVAHMFCNIMGLPKFCSGKNGIISLAFVAGVVTFFWLLFPVTNPDLYNDRTNNCKRWHAYCTWN